MKLQSNEWSQESQRVYYWIVLITCECYEKIAAAVEDMRAVIMNSGFI